MESFGRGEKVGEVYGYTAVRSSSPSRRRVGQGANGGSEAPSMVWERRGFAWELWQMAWVQGGDGRVARADPGLVKLPDHRLVAAYIPLLGVPSFILQAPQEERKHKQHLKARPCGTERRGRSQGRRLDNSGILL
ncbi:hypothetical protein Cob_v007843 [Colletotrichum orbiculare MAFF 240422]|uniref:Uncharacterized protein n=1 Tax=Colletotrichum orbiculare (strain 104-T / ATCC 96160 / CBS 514.97 / LARS 414 / MAFF 240422) TaxID=1213857 RepID=A0A484FNF5_COLOR|nr:hypothetical protein Cob_v007843 [Colletotrichum orbiculare MAFF 240422]